ncbi:MAG: RNA 2'-phosphotransferase [Caldilineaceae bacterium]
MNPKLVSTSKFLSLILRHQPETIGLTLDEAGWANVPELIERCNKHGHKLTLALLEEIVGTNEKQRFAFNADKSRIRANQGHSLDVDLQLTPKVPPAILYHGTATRFLDSIKMQGLIPGSRQHVHLSADVETATKVGQRHGKPVVLEVQAGAMHAAGIVFYQSENGVWLTNHVPASYLSNLG